MNLTEKEIQSLPLQGDFRLRGLDTTHLETFTDAAFAFAITMLVISVGDIPGSYQELIAALKATPAFLTSFAAIILFWAGRRKWSSLTLVSAAEKLRCTEHQFCTKFDLQQ